MAAPSAEDIDLLINVLRHDHEGTARCLRSRRAAIDAFLEFVAAHGLSVVVLRGLEDSPLRSACSPRGIEVLENRRREQVARSRQLLGELERLAGHFASAGLRFMLLKGPYLAARFYGDVQGREFVDLDLLVPAGERQRAFRLLAEVGHAQQSRVLLGGRLTGYFVHAFDFARGRANVDLHWCLSRHPSFRIDEAAIWAGRQSYAVAGRPYDVLSDEFEVVFAALSMLRDIERGRPKIKNLVDLLRILDVVDARLDWDAFFAARRSEGTLGPTVNILGLCLDVAGAHDFFPALHAALARRADRRVRQSFGGSPFLFAPARCGLGNKLWSARVHDASPAAWLLWWAVSLPFRVAVHRRKRRPNRAAPPGEGRQLRSRAAVLARTIAPSIQV